MERRVLIAIFLSFLVLYAYQAFFVRPAPKPATASTAPNGSTGGTPSAGSTAASAPASPAGAAAPGASSLPGAAGQTLAAAPAPGTTPLVGATEERDVRVETPHVVAVFTNRGARLKSWRLKAYKDNQGDPLELVVTELAATQPLPFSLRVADDATTGTLNGALYKVQGAVPEGVQNATTQVAFEYQDSNGVHAVKQFTLDPATHTVTMRATLSQGDRSLPATVVWGPGLGDSDSQTGRYAVKPGGLFSSGGKVTRLAARAVGTQPTYDQDFEYAGVDDHYFMTVALKTGTGKLTYQPVSIPPAPGSKDPARDLMSYSIEPAHDEPLTFYVGPKDFDTLAAIDRNLTKAINFGIFSVIVVPFLRSLDWINGYIGNYGWSIFALTILINLVLFPLNHKSVVSMRKMQEIQPETKAIQERYAKLKATDPAKQKMNQELMALYRERGVNPASGCIPILLTLPVFLAFYSLLTTAIELRGAPFIGWIHDLSQPDPYYVMPVLVGISQIVTQWMTPQAGVDPTQQKMMMIMPIVLIFVFVSTPAGALIYWLVGNVWRLGQQYLTNYLIGPPNIRTIRPPAERRVKRVGGGKTDAASST
jgi:YidC/Oxa1 family membrane protein insertase